MSHASEFRRARKCGARVLLAMALAAASTTASAVEETGRPKPPAQQHALQARPSKWTGDLDVLLNHRMIRFLVCYSPTLFYHDHGRALGIIAGAGPELEKYLNKKYPDKRPFTVVLIPTTRDHLFQGLIDGEGEVAGGSVTITPERLKRFDYLMPAAQGYQESGLDQNAKSRTGAIGIMQVTPSTGTEMKVGNISHVEPNIHAGTKYLSCLMDKYFQDAKFDEQNRNLLPLPATTPARVTSRGCGRARCRKGSTPMSGSTRRASLQIQRLGSISCPKSSMPRSAEKGSLGIHDHPEGVSRRSVRIRPFAVKAFMNSGSLQTKGEPCRRTR